MSGPEDKTVHLSFSVEFSDLFLPNLDLLKFRLLLSLGIGVSFVAVMVWIFLRLGEGPILFETAPLFIVFPLFASVVPILRTYSMSRKFVSRLSASQRQVRYTFSEHANGYEVAWGNSFSHIAWSDVSKIVEKQRYFVVFHGGREMRIIPKRTLLRAEDLESLRAIFSSNLKDRARLLPAIATTY